MYEVILLPPLSPFPSPLRRERQQQGQQTSFQTLRFKKNCQDSRMFIPLASYSTQQSQQCNKVVENGSKYRKKIIHKYLWSGLLSPENQTSRYEKQKVNVNKLVQISLTYWSLLQPRELSGAEQ